MFTKSVILQICKILSFIDRGTVTRSAMTRTLALPMMWIKIMQVFHCWRNKIQKYLDFSRVSRCVGMVKLFRNYRKLFMGDDSSYIHKNCGDRQVNTVVCLRDYQIACQSMINEANLMRKIDWLVVGSLFKEKVASYLCKVDIQSLLLALLCVWKEKAWKCAGPRTIMKTSTNAGMKFQMTCNVAWILPEWQWISNEWNT